MADPYASSSAPPPAGASSMPALPPGAGWAASVQPSSDNASSPDYLFDSDYDEGFRRSWGERLTYHTGSAYCIGAPRTPAPPRAAVRARRGARRAEMRAISEGCARAAADPARARAAAACVPAGFLSGGAAGLRIGLSESAGERQRIRTNRVLNAIGMRGPRWGNSLGCLAMMGSIFESLAYNVRGTDDLLNPAGAAALTGTIFMSTSGPRQAAAAGLGLGAAAAVGSVMSKQMSKMGWLKSFV